MSKPATVAVPPVGVRKHVSMRMVVVLPAPFGPRKPTIWPFWTSNEIWSTAVLWAYLFVSPLTVIIGILFEPGPGSTWSPAFLQTHGNKKCFHNFKIKK